jgi:hypothetical protein
VPQQHTNQAHTHCVSASALQRVLANKPDIALFTGDISYADHFNSQGLPKSKSYPLIRSYQPRW